MKESTSMIRKKDRVSSTGQMVDNTTEDGLMENSTESEHTPQPVVNAKEESGSKARELNGYQMLSNLNTSSNKHHINDF